MVRWEWSVPQDKLSRKWEQLLFFPTNDTSAVIIEAQTQQLPESHGREKSV
jgi:hypothetical protein